jgi:hypothetical protein
MDKRSSLLRKFVNYGEKKFYNIGPWVEVTDNGKHTIINYDRKRFYDTCPRMPAVVAALNSFSIDHNEKA